MMNVETEAIVCAVRNHGEHGTVVRVMTPDHGLVAAYVRGGRGRRMRPVLMPGNVVAAQMRARTDAQLPQASIELARSRASMLGEPIQAGAVEWVAALVTAALAERQPYPGLYAAMAGLLDAIEAAPSARGWGTGLARFELLLLAELGYGLDLAELPACVRQSGPADWPDLLAALDVSGDALFRDLLQERSRALSDCRGRLLDRLRRMVA
jgi:DNA repair protein RecO (recombination protein O)